MNTGQGRNTGHAGESQTGEAKQKEQTDGCAPGWGSSGRTRWEKATQGFAAHSRLHSVTKEVSVPRGGDGQGADTDTGPPLPFFFRTEACKQKGERREPPGCSARPQPTLGPCQLRAPQEQAGLALGQRAGAVWNAASAGCAIHGAANLGCPHNSVLSALLVNLLPGSGKGLSFFLSTSGPTSTLPKWGMSSQSRHEQRWWDQPSERTCGLSCLIPLFLD